MEGNIAMLVMYHNKSESMVTTLENEQVMINSLFTEKEGRKKENYSRVEGDIFQIPHFFTVYYTTLDED